MNLKIHKNDCQSTNGKAFLWVMETWVNYLNFYTFVLSHFVFFFTMCTCYLCI